MKGFPLQTSPGYPRCEAAGCCRRCLAPAISASTGVKRRRGCQLLTQPAVALSINSVTTFNYRQGSLKGFKMRRDVNSPPAPMLVYKSLSHLHSHEDVRRFPVGFGWGAGPEASFCIPRSALQEGSADVGNLRTNTICLGPGFGKPCPERISSDFWSWLRDVVNCNPIL